MTELEWLTIEDFTPGIRHDPSPGHPLGSATQHNTFCCHSNESRGLVPAPGVSDEHFIAPGRIMQPSIVQDFYRIGGVKCVDPVYTYGQTITGPNQNNTDVYVGIEARSASAQTRQIYRLNRHRADREWDAIASKSVGATYDQYARPKVCYFATGRSNNDDPSQAGPIVVGWVYGGWAAYFPDDTSPGSDGFVQLPGDDNPLVAPDVLVGHQGRAVIFPEAPHKMGTADGAAVVAPTNENLYWSDVNDWREFGSNLSGFFNVLVGYENPTGYGVVASNTADELLLIKARGGAVLVRGDLDDFTASNFPNVRGTGQPLDMGTHTPLGGYAYPVDASQVFLWQSGDVAENIAPQLVPDFFRVPFVDPAGDVVAWGYHHTQSSQWANYVLFGHNWFLDCDIQTPEGTPSAWKLWPQGPDDHGDMSRWRFAKYDADWKGRWLFAAPVGFRDVDDPVLVEFDIRRKSPYFSWQSHPLPNTLDPSRRRELRRVSLSAFGEGTVTVTVTTNQDPVGQSREFEFESGIGDATERRYLATVTRDFSVQGTHHQVRIESKGFNMDRSGALTGGRVAPSVCVPVHFGFLPTSELSR